MKTTRALARASICLSISLLATWPSPVAGQIYCGMVTHSGYKQEEDAWCSFACMEFLAFELGHGDYSECDFVDQSCHSPYYTIFCGYPVGDCCDQFRRCTQQYLVADNVAAFMKFVGFKTVYWGDLKWVGPPTSDVLYNSICQGNYVEALSIPFGNTGHATVICTVDPDGLISLYDPWIASPLKEGLSFGQAMGNTYNGGSGASVYAVMEVGAFFPAFVGIEDLGAFWHGSSDYSGVQLLVHVNDTADPADSLAVYFADNPAGPARKLMVVKPLSSPPPEGGVDISLGCSLYQESTAYYFWVDHGPGNFPMVRDPSKEDIKSNADNPILYNEWYWLTRDVLDAPAITEVYNPQLSGGFECAVSWDLSDDDEALDFYNVYRMTIADGWDGDWQWVGSVPAGSNLYVDDGVLPGGTYEYRVSAAHSNGGQPERLGTWNDFGESVEVTSNPGSPILAAYVRRAGVLAEMPSTCAVGCPGREEDTIVVDVRFPAGDASGPIPASEIVLGQPENGAAAFYPDNAPIPADSAATVVPAVLGVSSAYYHATFTVTSFGGCGVDSAAISLNGTPIGYAQLNLKSPDVLIGSGTKGYVGVGDFGEFGSHYPSSVCDCASSNVYSACSDFVSPDTAVTGADFAKFGEHYGHGDPSGGGNPVSDQVATSEGYVQLAFSEEQPLVGAHRLRVRILIDGAEPLRAMVIALACPSPRLSFEGWTAGTGFSGSTMCTPVVRNGSKQLFIGVLGTKAGVSGTGELGTASFLVDSDVPLALSASDFELVTADLMSASGRVLQMPVNRRQTSYSPPVYQDDLAQNFPNPFNPTTTISYSLAHSTEAELTVFNVRGALVRTLVNGRQQAGVHRVDWDGLSDRGQRVASGVYFYKLVAGSFVDTKKMTILK